MDKEQLYQSLYELEKQLKGIQSATTKVNQVVNSQKEMMTTVDKFMTNSKAYVSELKKTSDEYEKKFYDLAHDSFEKRNASFSTECTSLSEDLKKNLETANIDFKGGMKDLREQYSKSLANLADRFTQKIQESEEKINRISVSMDELIVKHLQPMVSVELPDLLDKKLKPFINIEMKDRINGEIQNLKMSSSDIIKGFSEKLKELDGLQQQLLEQSIFVKNQLTTFSEKIQQILDMNQATYLEEIGCAEKRLKEATDELKIEATNVSEVLTSKSESLARDVQTLDEKVQVVRTNVQTLDNKAQDIGISLEALVKKFEKSLTDMNGVIDGVATVVHTKANALEEKVQKNSDILKEEMTAASAQLECKIGILESKSDDLQGKVDDLDGYLRTIKTTITQEFGTVKGKLTIIKKDSDQELKRIEAKKDQQLKQLSEEVQNGNKKVMFIFIGMAFIILFQLVLLIK